MKPTIGIYLAGSIKKGHEKADETFWMDDHLHFLSSYLDDFEIAFLNPAFRQDDLFDPHSVFGRDMTQVFSSHVVFVDARDRRGLGVGAEMMWAKVNRIPVVTWAPKNSHYVKDHATVLDKPVANFIHPFIASLSDAIVNTLAEGADWISTHVLNPTATFKGIETISDAMQYYQERQLPRDLPMKTLLNNEKLMERMERPHPQVEVCTIS